MSTSKRLNALAGRPVESLDARAARVAALDALARRDYASEDLRLKLIEKGYDPQYGARPMRRAVERYLEDPFAEELLRGNVKGGDVVHVGVNNGKLVFTAAAPAGSEAASAS